MDNSSWKSHMVSTTMERKVGRGVDKWKRTSPRTTSHINLSNLTIVSDADDQSDKKVPEGTPIRHVRRRFKETYKPSCFVCFKLGRNKTQGKKMN